MSKNLKIILSVLALVSIGFSLAIVFDWNPVQKIKTRLVPTPTPTPTPAAEESAPEEEFFEIKNTIASIPQVSTSNLPVDEKYFDNMYSFSVDGSIEGKEKLFLAFFLEPETEIKAIFKGEVIDVNEFKHGTSYSYPEDPDFTQLWIEEENKAFKASYIFIGQALVEKGDSFENEAVLAKSKEGGLSFRNGANFSISILNSNNETLGISKELFDFTR